MGFNSHLSSEVTGNESVFSIQ